jgi:hypothetical protein
MDMIDKFEMAENELKYNKYTGAVIYATYILYGRLI